MSIQYITRKGTFDSGHRVMNERMKCFNVHGHTYLYELTYAFDSMLDIGYPIDFKEIKRVGCQWIDDELDHGMILNPKDEELIHTVRKLESKTWLMSLNGPLEYCNPTVENISKEVFLAQKVLFQEYKNLRIHNVRVFETPNCYTDCSNDSISVKESNNFYGYNYDALIDYAKSKGIVEYDDRKLES